VVYGEAALIDVVSVVVIVVVAILFVILHNSVFVVVAFDVALAGAMQT
jgi:hypothetical protein